MHTGWIHDLTASTAAVLGYRRATRRDGSATGRNRARRRAAAARARAARFEARADAELRLPARGIMGG